MFFKCKMCGGDLKVTNEKITECEYCGTTQTVPDGNDEKKTNFFNRANRLRRDNEFDKAAGVYESIVAEYPEEAEGYWGLVLCTYGIEYVDDSTTGKKIPTCHRTIASSIMDDPNFVLACEYADTTARLIYRDEAKVIDKLQKKIIEIVEGEEPYDIFICYKETDDVKKARTEDSGIAQDIYTELIAAGYKVFFSRVTLRDKAGMEYEPYIYAALKSAKVMLAIGTKFEYYDAPWVKNEWGRYLVMMADDPSKHLIPCFKNLDAYDIPKEFKNLQALDMGDVTFYKSLMENISRFVKKEATIVINTQTVTEVNPATDSFLKRMFMFLEDGEWKSANEYAEKVLDIDPECAEAYLGKLMAELCVKTRVGLKNCETSFVENANYKKLIRFANAELRAEVEECLDFVNEQILNAKEATYCEAISLMEKGNLDSCEAAISIFDEIPGYKDVDALKQECLEQIRAIKNKKEEEREEELGRQKQERLRKIKCCWAKSMQTVICGGERRTIGVKSDGSVVTTDDRKVSGWRDIAAVSCGLKHTVGLKTDGSVVADGSNSSGQCDVSMWSNIVAIATGQKHTLGLKADGTVVATGSNYGGQCNVSAWRDIVAIGGGWEHSVGLKSDGTVVATIHTGDFNAGQCDVSSWSNIVAIEASSFNTIGLKSSGSLVITGSNKYYRDALDWRDIVAVSASGFHIVGLKSDGTVIATGRNNDGECDVSAWRDIVAVATGCYNMARFTIGLKSDGTVVSTGVNKGDCSNVSNWEGIAIPKENVTITELQEIRAEQWRKAEPERKQREQYRNAGVCQHCGGELKGFLSKKCVKCGKPKDY